MEYNFDAMTKDELWEFWKKTNRTRPITFARELFPERPRAYVGTAKSLGHYASNKAVAMGLRLEGKIEAAIQYENICDSIYSRLPAYAKW